MENLPIYDQGTEYELAHKYTEFIARENLSKFISYFTDEFDNLGINPEVPSWQKARNLFYALKRSGHLDVYNCPCENTTVFVKTPQKKKPVWKIKLNKFMEAI